MNGLAQEDGPPDEPLPDDEYAAPISVRLGNVVPPEDPEDWTRPLTWVAAVGMLVAPLVTLAWFAAGPPADAIHAVPATYAVAISLAAGAAATAPPRSGRCGPAPPRWAAACSGRSWS